MSRARRCSRTRNLATAPVSCRAHPCPGSRSPVCAPAPGDSAAHASLAALWMVNTIPGLAFEIIYPFVNEMIVEIGVTDDPERVGFYSGIVESLFACVQVLTVMPCSYASDIVGRKPVILFGVIGVAISTVFFGFSKSFSAMLLSRSLGGALGGSWAAMRVMAGEMVPREHHGMAFAGMGMSYRVGQIVGLPLGGFLAHPERHLGSFFSGQFWKDYPFSLPCFVGGAVAALSALFGAVFIREASAALRLLRRKSNSPVPGSPTTPIAQEPPSQVLPIRAILTPRVINILISNSLTVLLAEVLFALYPLFGYTPRASGGLGLSEAQIGAHMSIRAVIHIAAMVAYPWADRRWGTLRLYKACSALWPLNIALFPVAGYMARQYDDPDAPAVWAAVLVLFSVWSLTSFTWACLSILVNDAAPFPEALARLNAVLQIAIVVPQAVAPALGTSLFAVSLKTGIFNGNLVWIVLIVGGQHTPLTSLSLVAHAENGSMHLFCARVFLPRHPTPRPVCRCHSDSVRTASDLRACGHLIIRKPAPGGSLLRICHDPYAARPCPVFLGVIVYS
ncbi:MFS general substrate transporter [Exidia glandulosa HHB12029]|uniref:MFS general substrate transporter n=1 Tax=Exidia glandulosa HHB12029 TaxID=1314781 RepID=A0A166BJ92_EXIGL|nr:MFS general substrate transporter [Exidia glandulosa HHB12029]